VTHSQRNPGISKLSECGSLQFGEFGADLTDELRVHPFVNAHRQRQLLPRAVEIAPHALALVVSLSAPALAASVIVSVSR